MGAELIQPPHNGYQPVAECEDAIIYQEQHHLSSKARKWLIAGAVVISGAVLYSLCFLLPSLFIPQAHRLQPFAKVKDLGTVLHPVSADLGNQWLQLADTYEEDLLGEETTRDMQNDDQRVLDLEEASKEGTHSQRLVLVGDIHGQQHEFHKLLKKVKYNPKLDTLLVLGDFISKGPYSIEVLDDLIDLDAKCILGNHEYYVLRNYANFHGLAGPEFVNGSSSDSSSTSKRSNVEKSAGFNDDPEYLLAKKLEPRHIQYINSCPIMMSLGPVPLHSKKNNGKKEAGKGVAVHAGLRWDSLEDLNSQNPVECVEMRSYLAPEFIETTADATTEKAVSWSKIWNDKHKDGSLKDDYVVYFGHDAHRGLNLKKWSKGIDTGCYKGGSLTAMLIWQESKNNEILHKEARVSVKC